MKDNQIQEEIRTSEKVKIYAKIKNLEAKNWYGMILISIVAILILFSTILQARYEMIEMPLIIINSVLFIVHFIFLYLAMTDKVMAYSGGLLVFLILLFLNILLSEGFYLGKIIWVLAIIGSYVIFIYEAIKLKTLKTKIENLSKK